MLGRVLDFLFPLECIACAAAGAHCCTGCADRIPLVPRFRNEEGFNAAAAFPYGHPLVRRLIHDLKFEAWTCALPALSRLMRRWLRETGKDTCPPGTIVLPVPLHPARMRERGFNQAELLARVMARECGFRLQPSWLKRVVRTKSQTQVDDRGKNIAGAFAARLPQAARGLPIMLIDDVWTTGATMKECAKALRDAGAGPVSGFALAWGSGDKRPLPS